MPYSSLPKSGRGDPSSDEKREIEELRALVAKMSAAEDETLDALEEQANALRRARSV